MFSPCNLIKENVLEKSCAKNSKRFVAFSGEKKQHPAATLVPLTAAAVATATIMYPVDVMRAITMSNAGQSGGGVVAHWKTHGIKGFVSQGVFAEIGKSSLMRVSKFFFYPQITQGFFGKAPNDCKFYEKALAGACATVPEILLISPLEVAKMGLQLDKDNKFKNNSMNFLKHIHKTKGFSGLYSGWAGMQWRQCFWTGTFFATLSWWKETVEPPMLNVGVPKQVATLTSGFLAGMFAVIPNAPGDVVRSVVQKKLFNDPKRVAYGVSPMGVMEHVTVAREIVAVSGVRGLYSGFVFKAMHLGGSGALMAFFIPVFSNLMGIQYAGV